MVEHFDALLGSETSAPGNVEQMALTVLRLMAGRLLQPLAFGKHLPLASTTQLSGIAADSYNQRRTRAL